MKTATKISIFIASIGLASLQSCKKSAGSDTTPAKPTTPAITTTTPVTVVPNNYTNPNTASAVCDYDIGDTSLTNHGWAKAFDDEFTSDLSNWGAVHGGMIREQQCYQPANATITNGVLQIAAKHETVTGPKAVGNDTTASFDYTSAWVVCKKSFVANAATQKVRIVARIKMAAGYGLTSLFWSYGSGAWPTQGEIDNAEVQGDKTKVYATDYSYGAKANLNTVSGGIEYNPVTEDLSACYHVYTMEWTQNALNSYLDGKLVESKTKGNFVSSLFGKPQFISLSLPVGGEYYNNLNLANVQAGTMYVDYVKVFTSSK
ncbi:MAG: family 16 glycosylhydrolase [Sphingobacteriales bacterium]